MSQIKRCFSSACTNKIQTNSASKDTRRTTKKKIKCVKQNAIRIEHRPKNICRLEHRTRNIFLLKAGRHAYNIRIIIDFSEWWRPMAVESVCLSHTKKNVKEQKNSVFVCVDISALRGNQSTKECRSGFCSFSVMYANTTIVEMSSSTISIICVIFRSD